MGWVADGQIVYQVKVDGSGAVTEARQVGTDVADGINENSKQGASAFKEMWVGACRQIGAEMVNLGKQAASAISSAVVNITKESVAAFAEYEQLAGGAQLMFGDAYGYIAEKAKTAYADVQMSQNDYLQQVNGFATGLKTALGGNAQAAAELADRIITAEADVVAATGNTQEAVQNAFNGIMKGNYTMLDNLQIGIKPTKEGMQEVIDKMNQWNAEQGKVTKYTIDNLADCEAAIVDYVAYVKMSGYAHEEGTKTIQGSLASTKAAWANMLVGLADDNADFGVLIDNFVASATNTLDLIIPRVEGALDGVVDLVAAMTPQLISLIPAMVDRLLPVIVGIIPDILSAVGEVLSSIIDYIIDGFPTFVEAGLDLLISIMDGITSGSGETIETITYLLEVLLNAISTHMPELIMAGIQLLEALLTGIVSHLPEIIMAGVELVASIAKGLAMALPYVVAAVKALCVDIKNRFLSVNWSEIGTALINGIGNGLTAGWSWLVGKVQSIASSLLSSAKKVLGIASPSKEFAFIGRMTTIGMEEGVMDEAPDLTRTVTTLYSSVLDDAQTALSSGVNLPTYLNQDIERNISTNLTATATTPNQTINVPLFLDGREIARATAWYTGEQLAWLEA